MNKKSFACAAAATMGIWYAICAIFVAIWPNWSLKLFSWMVHLVNVEAGVSFPGVIYGFVEIVVLAYVTAYVFAALYNRHMKS